MKTANLLSLSLLLAVGGLVASVGCSSPTVGNPSTDSADSTGDDDDSSSTTSSNNTTTTPAATATTTTDAGAVTTTTTTTTTCTVPAACTTCLGTNAAAAKFVSCDMSCQDDNCDDNCFTTSGCTDDTCDDILNQCDSACFTDTGTDANDPCLTCLGNSAAANYIKCDDQQQCDNNRCDDQCFEQACGNDERSCEQQLDKCDRECFE